MKPHIYASLTVLGIAGIAFLVYSFPQPTIAIMVAISFVYLYWAVYNIVKNSR